MTFLEARLQNSFKIFTLFLLQEGSIYFSLINFWTSPLPLLDHSVSFSISRGTPPPTKWTSPTIYRGELNGPFPYLCILTLQHFLTILHSKVAPLNLPLVAGVQLFFSIIQNPERKTMKTLHLWGSKV